MGTNFFTNEKENTLLEKIEGVFMYKKVHFFDALVGYLELPDILGSESSFNRPHTLES